MLLKCLMLQVLVDFFTLHIVLGSLYALEKKCHCIINHVLVAASSNVGYCRSRRGRKTREMYHHSDLPDSSNNNVPFSCNFYIFLIIVFLSLRLTDK